MAENPTTSQPVAVPVAKNPIERVAGAVGETIEAVVGGVANAVGAVVGGIVNAIGSIFGANNNDDSDGSSSCKPIIIDLDGDGIEVAPQDQNFTLFDFDDDGFKGDKRSTLWSKRSSESFAVRNARSQRQHSAGPQQYDERIAV